MPVIDREAIRCSEIEWRMAKEMTDLHAPQRLPHGWAEVPIPQSNPAYGARAYQKGEMHVIISAGWHGGQWWMHVSCTQKGRVPNYAELCEVKRIFVGDERQALHLFPPKAKHISIHDHCLHLWAALEDGDGLPDFGYAGTI